MDNLVLGLEISVIGFTVTMVTLLVLAGLLIIFTKVFYERKKEDQGDKTALQEIKSQREPAAKTRMEISPANGALRPEIVAAAIGAINYTLGKKALRHPVIATIQSEDSPKNFWAQAGRTRAVSLRQDFVSFKRGKLR